MAILFLSVGLSNDGVLATSLLPHSQAGLEKPWAIELLRFPDFILVLLTI
jgi:hypothetical protein